MDVNERRKRASSEAAEWWALLQGEDMTRAERESFIDWLRDSQTNIAEMLRLSQVHGALERFQDWDDISTDGLGHQAEIIALPPQRKPSAAPVDNGGCGAQRRTLRFLGLAATFAAIAILATFLLPQWHGKVIETERGERRAVTLDDGSEVQVDPQTRLAVQFDKDVRRVHLTQGRALFRVAKSANRPFQVTAGATTVRAIGTAFGVEQRAGDVVVVTVSEGKVAVSSPSLSNPPPDRVPHAAEADAKTRARNNLSLPIRLHPLEGQGAQRPGENADHRIRMAEVTQKKSVGTGEVLLGVNEQITVAMTGTSHPVRTVDSERELAWAEGRLVFRNDPVAKVIAEFNRYNRVQLYVPDTQLGARPVSGVFDAANPEAFIAFLQNAAHVRIERDEERSIVIAPRVSHQAQ